MRVSVSTLIGIAGLVCLIAGAEQAWPPAGFLTCGAALMWISRQAAT